MAKVSEVYRSSDTILLVAIDSYATFARSNARLPASNTGSHGADLLERVDEVVDFADIGLAVALNEETRARALGRERIAAARRR